MTGLSIIPQSLRALLRRLAYYIAWLWPKRDRAVLRGFPAYEDNLVAIYQGLESYQVRSIIWVADDTSVPPPVALKANTRLVKRRSLLDIYFSTTSRFLFLTHGHFFDRPLRNQISVNLWHGIPLKVIGRHAGAPWRSDTFTVATSKFTRKVFADAFNIPESTVEIMGQARTDRMFGQDRREIWERCFPGELVPDRIFLWLPTYRSTDMLKKGTDGRDFSNVYNCSDFSEHKFNETLRSSNAVCLIKPHPMAKWMESSSLSNIRHITDAWLLERGLTLYQLLGVVDCLISDISSVIADFLLLDRPILLLFEDIVEYESSRGFTFNPIREYLPADVAKNYSEFEAALKSILAGKDRHAERRAALKELFFDHHDGNATARILKIVFD